MKKSNNGLKNAGVTTPAQTANRVAALSRLAPNVRACIMVKIVFTFCLFVLTASAGAAEYSYHQVWSYKTRIGEEESTVLINHVDSSKKYGNVFHITIFNVKCGTSSGDVIKVIPYLAVSQESLNKSLLKLVATRYPYPKFHDGYVEWKNELEAGKAVVHNDSIANILNKFERNHCK